MFTRYPTRIAMERVNGYHVFVQSRGQCLRAISSAGRRWNSSTVTSLSWRPAIVVLSQVLTQASFKIAGRRVWFPESHGQLCVWSKEVLVESYVFSAVIGLFAGFMSASVRMRRKRSSRSRFVKDVVSWLRRWAVSLNGQGSRAVPGPSVPGRVRSAPSRRTLLQGCSSLDDEVSLARRESRADFPEVSLQLLDRSEWKLAANGGFFREENIMVLEARSILCAVGHADRSNPPGRLLVLSDNLALVLALCQGRSNFFYCVGSLRLVSGQVLSYRSGGHRQS